MSAVTETGQDISRAQSVFRTETGVERPRLALRSRTRVDTGGWLMSSRLWLFVTDRHIVLVAAANLHLIAPRQYFEAIELSQCKDSFYSHATGQLVLEPIKDVPFKHIKLSPIDANRVLDLIQQGEQPTDTPPPSTPNTTATENSRA